MTTELLTGRSGVPDQASPSRLISLSNAPLGMAAVLAALQFAALAWESHLLWSRAELTMDYQVFARAFWAVGHGHLTPEVYIPGAAQRFRPYIANHFELLTWPLALLLVGLLRLPVHIALLDVLQAAPTAATTFLVAVWGAIHARRRQLCGPARWAVVLTPALLSAVDIWQYRSDAFDFHYQELQGALLVGAIVLFEAGHARAGWLLAAALALTGDTAALVLAVLCAYLVISRRWRHATGMLAVTALTLLVPSLLHDNLGSLTALATYAQLARSRSSHLPTIAVGLASHPAPLLRALAARLLDIWGLVGGAGLLGVVYLPAIAAAVSIGIPSWLGGLIFSYPGDFQTAPLTCTLLLGSGPVLAWLARFGRSVLLASASGAVLLAAGWTVAFAPSIVSSITAVSSRSVGTSLTRISEALPSGSTVYTPNASLGVVGERVRIDLPLQCSHVVLALSGRPVSIVADPWRGIQTCSPADLLSLVSALGSLPGARTLTLPGGVIWVEWVPPAHLHRLCLSARHPISARYLATEPFARGTYTGRSPAGALLSPPGGGFAFEGIVGELRPRSLGVVESRLSVRGTAQVQVFDDATGRLLGARYLVGTGRPEQVRFNFTTPRFRAPSSFTDGFGPFRTELLPPLRFDPVELRVWVPRTGTSSAAVYSAWIGPAGGPKDASRP